MCSAHALFVFKVSRLNFLRSFFRPLRALPPQFWKSTCRRGATAGKKKFRSEDCFSNLSVCEAVANFWNLSERSFGRWFFSWKKSICPKDFIRAFSFFTRHTEGAVLLNFKWLRQQAQAYGKSATGAGRIIDPLSGGSARTRDQSDLRKRHIHFGRWNTTRKGRQHGCCRLADWAQGLSLCDWGNNLSHTKIYPHSRHL